MKWQKSRLANLNNDSNNQHTVMLTEREKQILSCILKHMSIKETSNSLYISEKAVEFHRTNIFRKYGVQDHKALLKRSLTSKCDDYYHDNIFN